MRPASRLLPLLIIAASIPVVAQEPVTLDQSLQFSYDGSRTSLGDLASANAYTRANYRFDLGLPIVAYRLGAADLSGTVGYVKQRTDAASDASIGLNTIGLQGALFPYQPYHLSFDYARATSPDLFGQGTQVGQSFGLSLIYRGWQIQDLHIHYRHGSTTGVGAGGRYDSWSVSDTERRGATNLHITADHQEASFGSASPWQSSGLSATSRTDLSPVWVVNANLYAFNYATTNMAQTGVNLVGNLGAWTSMTAVDASYAHFNAVSQRTGAFSESLAHTFDRFSTFSILGLTRGSTSGAAGAESELTSLIFGSSWRATETWLVMGDLSATWNSASGTRATSDSAAVPGFAGRTQSYHLGTSWGGGLPEVLRQAMFYWSDLRFQSGIQEQYPPDYLPPELSQALLKRKLDHQGQVQFTGDLYHLKNLGDGHQDWMRVQGGLSFAGGLMVQTLGDWRVDDRFTDAAVRSESKALSMYGAYTQGRTSLRFGLGYAKGEITDSDHGAEGPSLANAVKPGASTYYSMGLDTWIGPTPCGAMVYRNHDPLGMATTTLLTHLTTGFGKVRFNVTYQRGWRSDGLRTSQISLNLVRWFDTITLWGLGD